MGEQIINAQVSCITHEIKAGVVSCMSHEVNADIDEGFVVKGADGFSPTIAVAEDTDDSYKLEITDVNGSFITPNLKGTGGGESNLVAGDNIQIQDNVISVLTTNNAQEDNTRPITSAGVNTIVGNIDVLLSLI